MKNLLVPFEKLEELKNQLPPVSKFSNGCCFLQSFEFDGHKFEINFYKVEDHYNTTFWEYNPFKVRATN